MECDGDNQGESKTVIQFRFSFGLEKNLIANASPFETHFIGIPEICFWGQFWQIPAMDWDTISLLQTQLQLKSLRIIYFRLACFGHYSKTVYSLIVFRAAFSLVLWRLRYDWMFLELCSPDWNSMSSFLTDITFALITVMINCNHLAPVNASCSQFIDGVTKREDLWSSTACLHHMSCFIS